MRRLALLVVLAAFGGFSCSALVLPMVSAQAQATVDPPDGDADGTPDGSDQCLAQPGPTEIAGCPEPEPGSVTTSDDLDRDGIPNGSDLCANTNTASEKPIDNQGCGPFTGGVIFMARSTKEMQDDPDLHGQCENARGAQCRFHVTVTLSKSSARRLGIKARIVDVRWTTDKSTFAGKYVYRKLSAGIKRAVERAFSRAYARNIPVTMTLAGSVARGSGAPVAMGISTFTMKRKPPGGTAYRIEPSIGIGPDGPVAGGLTRPKSDADFRSVATSRQGCTGDAGCDGTPDSSDACPTQGG